MVQLLRAGAFLLTVGVCLLTAAEYDGTQQRTFTLSGSDRRLLVSNINGEIKVSAASGNEVRITVHEHWTAPDNKELAHGRSDVQVVMEQTGNAVSVTLDGPFRNPDRHNWDEHRAYHFRFDFDITVPPDVELKLKSVNGRVTAEGTAAPASVRSVNGPIQVVFARNPDQPCSFETVNGSIDVTFRPDLNAGLKLSTMHGDAYTDFDVQPVATEITADSSGNGKRFRVGGARRLRVGTGGVEHSFRTLNGTIKIRKGDKGK